MSGLIPSPLLPAPLPPSPFLLVEPADPDLAAEPGYHRAVGWGLESATEALVYFAHPELEIREVSVFHSAEHAQEYYSGWGELDLIRPAQGCVWPAGISTPSSPRCTGQGPLGNGTGPTSHTPAPPIWQAQQRAGAQIAYLYPSETAGFDR